MREEKITRTYSKFYFKWSNKPVSFEFVSLAEKVSDFKLNYKKNLKKRKSSTSLYEDEFYNFFFKTSENTNLNVRRFVIGNDYFRLFFFLFANTKKRN